MSQCLSAYLFPGGRGAFGASRAAALLPALCRVLAGPTHRGAGSAGGVGVMRQWAEEEDAGDEPVEGDGEQQGQHIEDGKVDEVDRQVELARHAVATLHTPLPVLLDVHQEEPEHAVDAWKRPDPGDDPLRSGHGANCLRLHWVADRDVPSTNR